MRKTMKKPTISWSGVAKLLGSWLAGKGSSLLTHINEPRTGVLRQTHVWSNYPTTAKTFLTSMCAGSSPAYTPSTEFDVYRMTHAGGPCSPTSSPAPAAPNETARPLTLKALNLPGLVLPGTKDGNVGGNYGPAASAEEKPAASTEGQEAAKEPRLKILKLFH